MKSPTSCVLLTAALGVADACLADSCFYQPGDNSLTGDIHYGQGICNQLLIDMFWSEFSFHKADWDNGFGFDAPCDVNQPLARTFNALYLLAYSAEDYANSDFSGNALRWGYRYSANAIDELDARCGSGNKDTGARATTYAGAGQDDRTVLKWPFFYGETVVQRAGTILHEARHAGGKPHDGGSDCPRGKSCDSSWQYMGANMFQVSYLWSFRLHGTRTTSAMRRWARTEAQNIIDRGFVTTPGFVVP